MDQYIQKQISATEVGIRKSLTLVEASLNKRSGTLIHFGLYVFLLILMVV